jgi:hypothetical protein
MEKKIRLFVVYGSETELLSEIYQEKNAYFIRIFKITTKHTNCFSHIWKSSITLPPLSISSLY